MSRRLVLVQQVCFQLADVSILLLYGSFTLLRLGNLKAQPVKVLHSDSNKQLAEVMPHFQACYQYYLITYACVTYSYRKSYGLCTLLQR